MMREGVSQPITSLQSSLLRTRSVPPEAVGCFWQERTIGVIRNYNVLSIRKSEGYILERERKIVWKNSCKFTLLLRDADKISVHFPGMGITRCKKCEQFSIQV